MRICACIVAVTVAAGFVSERIARGQSDDGRAALGPHPVGIVGFAAVQKELGLEGVTLARVKTLVGAFNEEMTAEMERAGIPKGRPSAKMGPEDRKAAEEKRRGVIGRLRNKYTPQLQEALTPAQYERLQQIQWQFGGIYFLTAFPELCQRLELTMEQEQKILSIVRQYQARQRALFTADRSLELNDVKVQDLLKERNMKVMDVLTKSQQESYTRLKGKPFDFTPLGGPLE